MNPEFTLEDAIKLGDECEAAARQAVREALIRHKKLGNSIATSVDGKIVWIPPEEIQIPEPYPLPNTGSNTPDD